MTVLNNLLLLGRMNSPTLSVGASKLARLTLDLSESKPSALLGISSALNRAIKEADLPFNTNVILPIPNRNDVFAIRIERIRADDGRSTKEDVFSIYPPQEPGQSFSVILHSDKMPEAFADIVAQFAEYKKPELVKEPGLIDRLRAGFSRAFRR